MYSNLWLVLNSKGSLLLLTMGVHEEAKRELKRMMMMNYFCCMVDRRKAFSPISSRDHCQRSSPSQISDTPRARFETCAEPEFRLRCMKLCSSNNHYTTEPTFSEKSETTWPLTRMAGIFGIFLLCKNWFKIDQ